MSTETSTQSQRPLRVEARMGPLLWMESCTHHVLSMESCTPTGEPRNLPATDVPGDKQPSSFRLRCDMHRNTYDVHADMHADAARCPHPHSALVSNVCELCALSVMFVSFV